MEALIGEKCVIEQGGDGNQTFFSIAHDLTIVSTDWYESWDGVVIDLVENESRDKLSVSHIGLGLLKRAEQ